MNPKQQVPTFEWRCQKSQDATVFQKTLYSCSVVGQTGSVSPDLHTPDFHIRNDLQKGFVAGGCKLSRWPEKATSNGSTDRDQTANNISEFLNSKVGFHVIDLSDVPAPGNYRDAMDFFKTLYANYRQKVHSYFD